MALYAPPEHQSTLFNEENFLKTNDATVNVSDTQVINGAKIFSNKLIFTRFINNISATVFNYLNGVSSNIQDQINDVTTNISTNYMTLATAQSVSGFKLNHLRVYRFQEL